jgi:hypothetical protein
VTCFVRSFNLAVLAAIVLAGAATAEAQEAHPRRAFLRYLQQADVAVVLVAEDRAWSWAADTSRAIALCSPGGSCRPIVERAVCGTPECPGSGGMVRADGPVADVEEYPRDLEDWTAETDALGRDPLLTPLMSYRAGHPDANAEPIHWITEEREGFSFELGAHGILGAASGLGGVVGADVSLGLRFVTEEDDSYDLDQTDDDLIDSLVGDYFGIDLRLHVMRGLDTQDESSIVAVGVAPFAWNAVGAGRLRLPSYLQTVLIEMGGIGGAGKPAAFYFGWNLPMSVMVSDRVAFDARASLYIIDGWLEGDGSEVLFQLSVGGTLR